MQPEIGEFNYRDGEYRFDWIAVSPALPAVISSE